MKYSYPHSSIRIPTKAMGNIIIINKIRRHWHMIKVCTSQPSSSMSPNTLNIFDFWQSKRRRHHRQRLKQEKALLANTFSTSPSKTATELSVSSVKFRTRSWTTNSSSRSSNSSNNANRRNRLAPRFTRHVQRVKECIVCQLAIFAIAHSVWLLHVNRATNVPRNRLPTPQHHQTPTTNCEPWEHIASVGCCCRSSRLGVLAEEGSSKTWLMSYANQSLNTNLSPFPPCTLRMHVQGWVSWVANYSYTVAGFAHSHTSQPTPPASTNRDLLTPWGRSYSSSSRTPNVVGAIIKQSWATSPHHARQRGMKKVVLYPRIILNVWWKC